MSILDRLHFRALDSNFDATAIIDAYDSMIWTESYNDIGDFELHGPNTSLLRSVIDSATYIFNSVTGTLMVIEKPTAEYTDEDGSTLTISGRSMTSVLDRRIINWSRTILYDRIDPDQRISKIICDLVIEAFCNDRDIPGRYWPNLQVINATSLNSVILPVGVGLQLTLGDNLLDVVTKLTTTFNLGVKCEFSPVDKLVKFIVYEGTDHSIQGENLVMFSDLYDNLLTGKDSISFAAMKNTILVAGAAEDPDTKRPKLPQMIENNNFTGINRREMYLKSDQNDVVYIDANTTRPMTDDEYIAALIQAGTDELNKMEHKAYRNYEGEILETDTCKYGTHFNLGDVVAFRMPHSQVVSARLEGITFSDDRSAGKTLAPKFNYLV